MKAKIRMIRLLLGAAACETSHIPVADEFVQEVAVARSQLVQMSATDLFEVLVALSKTGLNIALDVKTIKPFSQKEERSRPPDTRR